MPENRNKYAPAALAAGALLSVLALITPQSEIVISVIIRLMAAAIALYYSIKLREWKLLLLMAMYILMSIRQILTLFMWIGLIETTGSSRFISELPGFLVTLLTLITIIYIGNELSRERKIILKQNSHIDKLSGLLPICSKCKRIRDDEGYWKQIESYIEQHSETQFTHGLCEDCADELYGNEKWYKKMRDDS
ncbi:hypothetical protein [Spirochaeta isovalerica]|uniref:Uncharacterized protein n=1 Tax=Spirochaeta isovalerica TaxID=150 RepID=A0A841RFL4_9SPIO|nr:hypothetical protein [Spirochaeta isovalerica]MBB6481599.1 hypothetical protein [Spirochaeta isovalerica]